MTTLNIVVIDDDEITLDLIVNMLENDLSASVISFSRSALAREFLIQQTPGSLDMVISDMVMPEYDGLALLRECRNTGLEMPFVLMTAYESSQTKILARQLGAVAYLVKPIVRKKLIKLIKQQAAN